MLISNNGISKVWKDGGWIFKSQPKYMTDNEIWALRAMWESGYVPFAEQVDVELIRIQSLNSQRITDSELFIEHCSLLLRAMDDVGLRHGDLTPPHVLVINNKPKVIDWGESRVMCDPRPDKRREGDKFWITKTMKELLEKNSWR